MRMFVAGMPGTRLRTLSHSTPGKPRKSVLQIATRVPSFSMTSARTGSLPICFVAGSDGPMPPETGSGLAGVTSRTAMPARKSAQAAPLRSKQSSITDTDTLVVQRECSGGSVKAEGLRDGFVLQVSPACAEANSCLGFEGEMSSTRRGQDARDTQGRSRPRTEKAIAKLRLTMPPMLAHLYVACICVPPLLFQRSRYTRSGVCGGDLPLLANGMTAESSALVCSPAFRRFLKTA